MKFSIFVAASLFAALPSSAQSPQTQSSLSPTLIEDGDTIEGSLDGSSWKTTNNHPFSCYILDAPAGTAWEIDLRGDRQTRIWIARGESCDSISTWDLESSGSGGFVGTTEFSRAKFVSGGGAYFVVARMYDGKEGSYTLEVRRSDTGGRKLKPAIPLERLAYLPDTPSTAIASNGPTPNASGDQGPVTLASAPARHSQDVSSTLDPEIRSKWGALAYLSGSYWTYTLDGSDGSTLMEYSWKERGRVLEVRQDGVSSTWELRSNGKLVFRDANGKDTKEKWIVAADGSVSRKKEGYGGDYILTLRPDGPDRLSLVSRKEQNALSPPATGAYIRLNEEEVALAKAMKLQIQDGIFESASGAVAVLGQQDDVLTLKTPTGPLAFERQPNAEFHYKYTGEDVTEVFRIIDPLTVELSVLGDLAQKALFKRRHGTGVQSPELKYGLFKIEGFENQPGGAVFQLSGNTLFYAEGPSSVGVYPRGADGLYHSQYGSGFLRIVDMFTVDLLPPPGGSGKTYRYTRAADASPNYIAEAQQNMNRWMAEYEAQEAARYAEEDQLAWEEEQYREEQAETTTNNIGGILGAFAKGLSDATASNAAMEQSMRDAANEGIRRGRAEYARRQAEESRQLADQRGAAAERAQIVREQQAAFARQEQERLAAAERTRLARLEQELIPQASSRVSSTVGSASTYTDANRCVTSPEVSSNAAFQGNTSASVINGCGQPVDVLICLKRASDWNCGTDSAVQPQAAAIHSSFNATGPVHVDAKTTGNSRPYVYPAN